MYKLKLSENIKTKRINLFTVRVIFFFKNDIHYYFNIEGIKIIFKNKIIILCQSITI